MKYIKKLDVILITIVVLIFAFSSCGNSNVEQQTETIKVVEADSITEKANIYTEDTANENTDNKSAPVYYNTYKVNLDVNTETRNITGIEKVNYKNITGNDLNKIYFNLYLNAFSSSYSIQPYFSQFESKIFKYGKDTGLINIKSVHINNEDISFTQSGSILEIKLPQVLKNEEETEITLQFGSYIPKIAHRTGANNKAMWLGNFIPILCKYDETGWRIDSYYAAGDPFYSDISNYEVKVSAPKEYTVVGTGTQAIVETEDRKITTLTANLVRDFAFAISEHYKVKSIKPSDDISINFYYYSDDIFDVDSLLDVAQKSIRYYSEKFGSYPYNELDIVETELFFNNGGMEYPAFIMMDSGYLKKQSSVNSIVHEIGHQWLYNIIGNDQIKEAWLDEGLNSYLQEGVLHSKAEVEQRMIDDYNYLTITIKNTSKEPLNLSLPDYNNWSSYYNSQYTRAKLMVYSLNKKMGDELFDEFLKLYYKKYSFKIAKTQDFIDTAQEVYGKDLTYFFDSWINQDELPQLN